MKYIQHEHRIIITRHIVIATHTNLLDYEIEN